MPTSRPTRASRNFTEPVLELARADARNLHLRGFIVCESSYPVPWLLGDFSRVGYYSRKKRQARRRAARNA